MKLPRAIIQMLSHQGKFFNICKRFKYFLINFLSFYSCRKEIDFFFQLNVKNDMTKNQKFSLELKQLFENNRYFFDFTIFFLFPIFANNSYYLNSFFFSSDSLTSIPKSEIMV